MRSLLEVRDHVARIRRVGSGTSEPVRETKSVMRLVFPPRWSVRNAHPTSTASATRASSPALQSRRSGTSRSQPPATCTVTVSPTVTMSSSGCRMISEPVSPATKPSASNAAAEVRGSSDVCAREHPSRDAWSVRLFCLTASALPSFLNVPATASPRSASETRRRCALMGFLLARLGPSRWWVTNRPIMYGSRTTSSFKTHHQRFSEDARSHIARCRSTFTEGSLQGSVGTSYSTGTCSVSATGSVQLT